MDQSTSIADEFSPSVPIDGSKVCAIMDSGELSSFSIGGVVRLSSEELQRWLDARAKTELWAARKRMTDK